MTRDEAIKILSRIWGGSPQHDLANSYADAFVALGMLKLDEPKSAAIQVFELMGDASWRRENLFQRLAEGGFEIVSK